MEKRLWNVYLSGEIHTDWRKEIAAGCERDGVPVRLMGPETDHAISDGIGEAVFGKEDDSFYRDHKAAKINAIRNKGVIQNCDLVIVRFGDKYRQWNAAFDAGQAVAWGKSLITWHAPELDHALKEVDAQALAVTRSSHQIVQILAHATRHPF